VIRSATISECGRYRYDLVRRWDDEPTLDGDTWSAGTMLFVMLNPSTADALVDDRTVRRCIGFAKREGFGGMAVVNLFAWRSKYPSELADVLDPVGPEWSDRFRRWIDGADTIVAAWGAHPLATSRTAAVDDLVRFRKAWMCLGTTKSGAPRHPLYLAASQPLVEWP
jgi:hypothetical protein